MATQFTYDESDFAAGASPGRLLREIKAAAIVPAVQHVNRTPKKPRPGFTVVVTFDVDLSAGEVTTLDAVVAAHDPTVPLPPGRTVAELATLQPIRAGHTAWARDGRRLGEGPGLGSGVLVYSDGAVWRVFRDDSPVTA